MSLQSKEPRAHCWLSALLCLAMAKATGASLIGFKASYAVSETFTRLDAMIPFACWARSQSER